MRKYFACMYEKHVALYFANNILHAKRNTMKLTDR